MRFKKRFTQQANIDLIPMIDVVFQLILFFLVSTTFAMLPGISLKLPESSTSEATETSPIVIGIVSAGELYINDRRVTMEELDKTLAGISGGNRKETVSMEADKNTPYSLTVEILDLLRKNGFYGIQLRTLEKQGSLPADKKSPYRQGVE